MTNWDEISVPEASELKTPSFEHLEERLQKMVIGQDDSTEAIRPYVVDLIYVLILDEKDLNSGEYGVDEE